MSVTEPKAAPNAEMHYTLTLGDEAATAQFAVALAQICRPADCLLLRGEVGAGKTTFARAFIRALCPQAQEIVSPTFTLVQTYNCEDAAYDHAITLWHFDLYRVKYEEELMEIALEDALQDGISLIEWPDIAADMLPSSALALALLPGEHAGARRLDITADASWKERLALLREIA